MHRCHYLGVAKVMPLKRERGADPKPFNVGAIHLFLICMAVSEINMGPETETSRNPLGLGIYRNLVSECAIYCIPKYNRNLFTILIENQ